MAFCECHNCKWYKNNKCVLKKPLLNERTYCDFEANEEFVKEETLHEAIKKIRKLKNVPNIYKKIVEERITRGYYFGTDEYYKKKVK